MADTLIAFPQYGKSGGQVIPIKAKDNGDGSYSIATNGNALVPANAPIQPPQAFVDTMNAFLSQSALGGTILSFSGFGITSIDASTVFTNLTGSDVEVDLSNNSLNAASVNGVLANFVSNGATGSFIDLSGQTPPRPPTGQGIADKATLIGAGWTVNTD